MRYIGILFLIITSVFSAQIKDPKESFMASGAVIDMFYKNNKIFTSTDAGEVDIFDIKTKKIIQKINVPKIKDFLGDEVNAKIFSVDIFDNSIMLLSQDRQGFSRVHIQTNKTLKLILDYTDELSIIKAKYIDKNTLLLALLSNELISYDINKDKINYRMQVNGAKFSDFYLSEDKQKVVIADESGDVSIINTTNGKHIKVLNGKNLDNVFQISYKNGIIVTAGQDRRVAVYNTKTNSSYYKKANFIVYSVGLSPSGKIVGFSSDEENNLTLFDTSTQAILGVFGKNEITISNIVFINENDFLVSSNGKIINLYSVK